MKNKKYIVYLVVSILVLTIGVSYAYFKARVNGEGKSISLRSKGIYVLYSGDATLASESISPGWSETKEFTVENQGSNNEVYNIYIEGLVNTFVTSGYLQYKITSSNGYNMTEFKDIPKSNTSTDTVLAYSVPIKSKEKQIYKVELIYKETEEDQSADMGKILSGILKIQVGTKDPNLFTASVVVINGSSDTNSKEVYKGNDVTFTITPNEGYTLEDASISCSNGTLTNNLLTITNISEDTNCTIMLGEDAIIKTGTLAYQILQDNPNVASRTDFTVVNTETTTGTIYVQSSTSDNQMTEDMDGDGIGEDVYYFSGNHEKNWVKFGKYSSVVVIGHGNTGSKKYDSYDSCVNASSFNKNCEYFWNVNDDIYWRIIRINEDGSVRLMYSGTDPNTTEGYIATDFDTEYNTIKGKGENPMYVGYMYGTSGSLASNRTNENSSTIKTYIDNWYSNGIAENYDKYVSKTAIYCNDRSVSSGTYSIKYNSADTYLFNFAPYSRTVFKKLLPSFKCGSNGVGGLFETTQAVEDKFSASTTGGGNGQLTNPVALITIDELKYAGALYNTNLSKASIKLNATGSSIIGNSWLSTMSPGRHSNSWDLMMYLSSAQTYPTSTIDTSRIGNSVGAIRPVLSLKACVKYSSGDGSSTNPYQVTIDSTCATAEN